MALVKERDPAVTPNQQVQSLRYHTLRETDPKARKKLLEWDAIGGFGAINPKSLLRHNPTGWPDQNPLALGPWQVVQRWPMSLEHANPPGVSADQGEHPPSADSAPGGRWGLAALALVCVVGAVIVIATMRRRGRDR